MNLLQRQQNIDIIASRKQHEAEQQTLLVDKINKEIEDINTSGAVSLGSERSCKRSCAQVLVELDELTEENSSDDDDDDDDVCSDFDGNYELDDASSSPSRLYYIISQPN